MTNPLLVEQRDRDAANNVLIHLTGYMGTAARDGEMDDYWLVQAFARHRLSSSLQSVGEVERLREHIAEQAAHAETRIQYGIEMGATIWRIALEDIVRKSRQALATLKPSIEQD